MSKSYRVTVKVRNNLLLKAIESEGYTSIPKFCKAAGVSYPSVLDLINMKTSPLDKNGDPTMLADQLCIFTNRMLHELFDDQQMYAPLEKNASEFEASMEEVRMLMQDSVTLTIGAKEGIMKVLEERLTEREVDVLNRRFGLTTNESTLTEIAEQDGVTRERIRQIECKALRKLRHPKISSGVLAAAAVATGIRIFGEIELE